MGTHGLYGYVLNGIYYLMYVHYDGDMLMSVMKREAFVILKHCNLNMDIVKSEFEKVKYIYGDIVPTKAVIEHLKPWTNLSVDFQTNKSWYCLLHHCQKSLIHTLSSGFMLSHDKTQALNTRPEYGGFMCWWNLDINKLEFYAGTELIQDLDPINLIQETPCNFPKKTLEEIQNNYINNFNVETERINELEQQLIELKQTLDNLSNGGNEIIVQLPSSIAKKIIEDVLIENLTLETLKTLSNKDKHLIVKTILREAEYELCNLKEYTGSRYISILWRDLGVIHYE